MARRLALGRLLAVAVRLGAGGRLSISEACGGLLAVALSRMALRGHTVSKALRGLLAIARHWLTVSLGRHAVSLGSARLSGLARHLAVSGSTPALHGLTVSIAGHRTWLTGLSRLSGLTGLSGL